MIEYECTNCGDPGPHSVTRDLERSVTAICRSCFTYMHVVLYDVQTPTEQVKDT